MLYALAVLLSLFLSTPANSAMECDTTSEDKIQEAIAADPTKLVKVLEGPELSAFLAALTNNGYLVGTLSQVDKIYIVDAGMRPGYTGQNVWLFIVQDGCLIASIPAIKSIIIGMLP